MKTNWNTYYLYHEGNADQVLKEIVHPAIKDTQVKLEKTVRFFFIRYFENGYHVRLRIDLSSEESPLFRSILSHHISFCESNSDMKMKIILKEAQYIPETERYGNAETIVYAENQFYASSRLILKQIAESGPLTASDRYSLALRTHLAFFKGMELSHEHIIQLCDRFVESWLPVPLSLDPDQQDEYKDGLLVAFQKQFYLYQEFLYKNAKDIWNPPQDIEQDPFLLRFIEANRKVRKEYTGSQLPDEATDEAILSFIHMTNNRAGIVNSEESYLIFLIRQTIAQIKNHDYQ